MDDRPQRVQRPPRKLSQQWRQELQGVHAQMVLASGIGQMLITSSISAKVHHTGCTCSKASRLPHTPFDEPS